jgi:hypothetical protein
VVGATGLEPMARLRGSTALNVVPSRSGDRATIEPPCARTIWLAMNRLSPTLERSPVVAARLNASKMPACEAAEIAGPTLYTSMVTPSPVHSVVVDEHDRQTAHKTLGIASPVRSRLASRGHAARDSLPMGQPGDCVASRRLTVCRTPARWWSPAGRSRTRPSTSPSWFCRRPTACSCPSERPFPPSCG